MRKSYPVSKSGQRLMELFGHHRQLTCDKDESWVDYEPLHQDLAFGLSQFRSNLSAETAVDRSKYKPQVAKKELADRLMKARQTFLTFITKHVERADSDVEAAKNAILRVTEAPRQTDPMQAMLQELRFQEIRGILRNKPVKERAAWLEGHLDRIQAVVTSPDEIIGAEKVTEIRRSFAFDQDPDLRKMESDTIESARLIRKRCAEGNAVTIDMLRMAGIKDDPLPYEEYAALFPGKSEHEKFLVEQRIQRQKSEADLAAKREKFDEANKGFNFQVGERVSRLELGIPHET